MSEIQFIVKVEEMKELKLPNEEILKPSSRDSRGCRCFEGSLLPPSSHYDCVKTEFRSLGSFPKQECF